MVKKSLFWTYRVLLWVLGIAAAVLVIIALAIHFFLMPHINDYKDKIAAYATKASNQKVVIGNITADWQGINPHFSVSNIDIYDGENRPALQLKNTEATLSWLSIPMLEPKLSTIIIRNPELTVRRTMSGEVFVAGISLSGASKPDLPNWLLRQSSLEILNAKALWLDELRNAPALSLSKLNLQISSPPWKSLVKNHRVVLSTLASAGTNNPIKVEASLYGDDVSKPQEWSGNIQLQVNNANLAAFKPWIDYPIDLQSGTGSTKISAKFAHQQVQSITSDVAFENVKLIAKANAEPIALNKLSGIINWKSLGKGNKIEQYQLDVEHLSLSAANGLNVQDMTGNYSEDTAGEKSFKIKLANINLKNLNAYLTQLPLPAEMLEKLVSSSPKGNLNEVILNWEGKQNGAELTTGKYLFNSKFTGLSILAQQQGTTTIPGFSNLSGQIHANEQGGKLNLNTQNAQLDFKGIFRWPIPVDKLNGEVTWNIGSTATTIAVNKLEISNPHVAGVIEANYLMDGKKGGLLDLKGKFGKSNAKYARFYYPIMLEETTLHWLDTSILAGRVEDINLIVKGRLEDFPFVDSKNNLDTKLGLFRVTAKVSDSTIEYGTDWPLVEGLGLDLLFEGKRMELNANKGHVFGNQIIKSRTVIAQLDADNPLLTIDSEIKGPVSEGIKFVNGSPVAEVAQGFTKDLKTSGLGNLNLSLKIPLENIEAANYKGLYQIVNGSMESPDIPPLNNINGALEFTENSLTAKNIRATALGSPLVFNLASGKDKSIRIAARGRLTDETIKQNLGNAANYINGSAEWIGDILIQNPRVTADIRSDLFGITSTLPAPMNKTATERINMRIDRKQELATDSITLNFANKLNGRLNRILNNGMYKLERGVIRLGAGTYNPAGNAAPVLESASEAAVKGFSLYGNMDYMDADAWLEVANHLQDTKPSNSKFDLSLPIRKIGLNINTLDIFGRRINQLKLQNKTPKDNLQFNIQSREITGDVQWFSQDNGKLVARLSNFIIPDATPAKPNAAPIVTPLKEIAKDFKKLNQDYPALDITADNFEFDKKKLGGLELVAYPQNDNWVIQRLKLITPESIINADGQWNNWVRSPNTRLNVKWTINDLGKMLKRFGHDETIKGGDGELIGQLNWAGSPHEFNVLNLNGNLQFEVHKGQILKVQPGVGRLFGLLSLQSLPRRLSLDFRDLFSSGFAFDKIDATVKIDRGILRSDNFEMSGPAADVKIQGETNIQKETQNLLVKVMPHISDSLSLAALAGGPLVGAVAFLAQKILKDPLNKIASTQYQIVGTWDNPQEVNTPDASNSLDTKNSPLN